MNRRVVSRIVTLAGAVPLFLSGSVNAQVPNGMTASQARTIVWPVKTREHVDLWLHGFAMLNDDTVPTIPLFRPGYRDALTVLKNKANVLTQLDVNVDHLRERLHKDKVLANAQFVSFYFSSLDEMQSIIKQFVATEGNADNAKTRNDKMLFAMLNSYFPTAAARAWLALFSSGLWDEESKFFHGYWMQQQRERAPVIDSVQALWQTRVRPHLQGFLNNSQQRDGDIILSVPLAGEGRTMSGGLSRVTVGVTFPDRPADAAEAVYGFAHEIMGTVAHTAIQDNVTPAQQRSGVAAQLESPAAVRGGLILLEKFVPELADGYARYYLQLAGKTPGAAPRTQLEASFPLPDAIRDALARQMEIIQGGI